MSTWPFKTLLIGLPLWGMGLLVHAQEPEHYPLFDTAPSPAPIQIERDAPAPRQLPPINLQPLPPLPAQTTQPGPNDFPEAPSVPQLRTIEVPTTHSNDFSPFPPTRPSAPPIAPPNAPQGSNDFPIGPTPIGPTEKPIGPTPNPLPPTNSAWTPTPTVPPLFERKANSQSWGPGLLNRYQSRAQQAAPVSATIDPNRQLPPIPPQFQPWWTQAVVGPADISHHTLPISIDTLIERALRHSPHIQVMASEPHIRKTALVEEAAEFDWQGFAESKYNDQNDPVGNTLTTGNNDPRFKQKEWYEKSGLRRKNRNGGEFEISQRLGYLDNNSRFLIPPNQGSARLALSYRQPLLQGRGRAVNESLILLAKIDYRSASDDFLDKLQQHLVQITETYWELVRARAVYFQRKRLLQTAQQVLDDLKGRTEVDSLDRQIFRARSAVAKRQSEITRSLASIKNAEAQLRLLVNDPEMIEAAGAEYTPTDFPIQHEVPIDMADAISTALANRPDISKAIRDLQAASTRLGIAQNNILPKLDLLFGTYVAGLAGDSDVFRSWSRQFSQGRPGFNIGFNFEVPIGNRAAHARHRRREWEVTQAVNQFRVVVESALTEVEIAVRDVTASHTEMVARFHAMLAAREETRFLIDRWQTLPGLNDSAILLLEDLLESQERLADEESAYVESQVRYAVSLVKLKQAMGTLFQID